MAWDSPVLQSAAGSRGAVINKPMYQIRPGTKACRKFFGRWANVANDTTNGATYQILSSVEQEFDAIQLAIGTIQTSGTTVRSACYFNVVPDASYTDAQLNSLPGWQFVDWSENDGNSVRAQFASFALSTSRPRYLFSDIKAVNAIPRTDGGSLPLICVRLHLYPNNATPSVLGDGTSDTFANVSRSDGRTMKIRKMVGQGMTTFGAGAVDANQSPLVAIIYYCKGKVVNVQGFGDSTIAGRGTSMGDGYIRPETIRRSNKNGIAWEYSDSAWDGQGSVYYHNIAMDAIGQFPIDIAFYAAGTPNDVPSGASAATAKANINAARYRVQQFIDKCRSNGVIPIITNFAPVNTVVNDYTLCDGERIALNTDLRALRDRGILLCDTDSVLAGQTVNGQVQILAGATTDNIHANDTGNALISAKEARPCLDSITIAG